MLKLVLFLAILGYICFRIGQMESFFSSQTVYFQTSIFSTKGLYLAASILLLPFNLLFEALKWQEATKAYASISVKKSLQAIVTGQALNLILPANIGHMAGRLANMESKNQSKLQGASLVFICQTAQMLVTFLAFLVGISCLGENLVTHQFDWAHILAFSFLILIIGYLAFNILKKNAYVIEILSGIRKVARESIVRIFVFSALRYITFCSQFILVLYFLGIAQSWAQLAMALSLVFMAKSLMPSFNFLSDLGIREFAALLFLPVIGLAENTVIAGSLWVWVINILLPTLFGAFLLLRTKLNFLFC